jgi:hypothetical protein
MTRPFQPAETALSWRWRSASPVRLNVDTTGMCSVAPASWPTRLALNSEVWITSGRQRRSTRRSFTTAHGQV